MNSPCTSFPVPLSVSQVLLQGELCWTTYAHPAYGDVEMLDLLELERGLSDLATTKDLLRTAAVKAWFARNSNGKSAAHDNADDPYPSFQSQVTVAERTQDTDQAYVAKKKVEVLSPLLCLLLLLHVPILYLAIHLHAVNWARSVTSRVQQVQILHGHKMLEGEMLQDMAPAPVVDDNGNAACHEALRVGSNGVVFSQ